MLHQIFLRKTKFKFSEKETLTIYIHANLWESGKVILTYYLWYVLKNVFPFIPINRKENNVCR